MSSMLKRHNADKNKEYCRIENIRIMSSKLKGKTMLPKKIKIF